MEPEQRGRASRASSTSSLGREVRCGCQYYQSDSLLPERSALLGRPPSRTMQQPPAVRCSEHEYEPIAAPTPSPSPKPVFPPVVRITETDVVAVADSDDSIDDRARLPPELTRIGDVVLPLDGKIEDTAMEGRELGENGDTSEEQETPQQLQERLEERFLSAPSPGAESRTDAEVNTSQVDSLALEELPLRRGARGLPQRLKTQAGKLRSRLRNIQRPTLGFADRQKPEKTRSGSSGRSDRSRTEKRPSRMDRIRSSFSERTRFNLPNRPRFSLPDRSKFHLPERPKFNLKKPNIRLPNALTRSKKPSSPVHEQQRSTDSTVGSRRNIFDLSTYPRIFDRKSKNRDEYTTSTPKDSRAQSAESATFPRTRKNPTLSDRWAQRFEETAPYIDEDRSDAETAVERARPWRRPSLEAPRLSLGVADEALSSIPWEEKRRLEQLRYTEYEQESTEASDRQARPRSEASRTEEEELSERMELEPGLYKDREEHKVVYREEDAEEEWTDERIGREDFRPVQRSRSLEEVLHAREKEQYGSNFPMVDPRRYGVHKTPSEEEEYEEDMDMDEEPEPSSAQSDREQQHSSGSSCDRRRRGVIEEIDSDEFFLREAGLSQGDANLGKYLSHEIRDALRDAIGSNALADEDMRTVLVPPQRPTRKRTTRNQKEGSIESYDTMPPVRPNRDPNRARRSESADEQSRERTRSDSRHRVVYQTDPGQELTAPEPLDDIVVVKPVRRKSRSSQRSQSQTATEEPRPPSPSPVPPVVPTRRKRLRKQASAERVDHEPRPICNGHTEWTEKPLPPLPATTLDETRAYASQGIMMMTDSEEDIRRLMTRLREEEYMEPGPVPPKRRSRSRGTSVAQDEDRTSHGAESLPEADYAEEEIPPDDLEFARDLSGYAIVEKRDKPARPPPPPPPQRRKRDKFATTPRPITAPKRPQRAYSTLGPAKTRDGEMLAESFPFAVTLEPEQSAGYVEVDSDDAEQKDLRSSEVLSKMQGRPLPAPPRPPRFRKDHHQTTMERSAAVEATAATQTDPLPDDMVIEEEVTQAKLVVMPSRSGSQITVSTERIPSPSVMAAPLVPPLPSSQRLRKEDQTEPAFDTVSLTDPSPAREPLESRHRSAPHLDPTGEEPLIRDEDEHARAVRSVLLSNEPVRIGNLEVGDLRVDRLSVSQIEAGKIVASEVDALLISASEIKGMGAVLEGSFSPSIIKELIAIRSHLEIAAASRARDIQTDIPVKESRTVQQEQPRDQHQQQEQQILQRQSPTEDDKSMSIEEQKVVKREVIESRDSDIPVTHTLAVAQVDIKENPVTRTPNDRDIPLIHSPPIVATTKDKPLRFFDSESPLSLSSGIAKELEVEEFCRVSLTPSVTTTGETMESTSSATDEASSEQTETTEPGQDRDSSNETAELKSRKTRSRSPSPISISRTRETASPIRSLPPAISVTPDTPDVPSHSITSEMQPQRAVISYTSCTESASRERETLREFSQSPLPSSFPIAGTHLIAFPASQVPAHFLSLAAQTDQRLDNDPSIADSTRQLLRILRLAGIKAMRHFVSYTSTMIGGDDTREKIKEVELALCALLILIAGLLIFFFGSTRTVTHHHHWDYFNPPK
ncbi:bromodomain-containing protein 4 [Colletes gigas]|uniref:bromodomain-containing protein 4 n=1 Tax=Colletes gigas TaxID=935657 RepID=UPI001C9ACDAC|nr:bromodomain-containing protein 4 [Colletes gigas]